MKLTIALPAALHRNLIAYAEFLAKETGKTIEPAKLIAPMLEKFVASDRGLAKARNATKKDEASTSLSPKPLFGFPYITERFSVEEVREMTPPLASRIAKLEAELAQFRAASTAAESDQMGA
ncbi:DUF2274 domain-containing protein [Methylocystis sp. B8]|uniref:DUF2274 domain-containing protein n=1 Tax=Methylocystis sp. B8 TaxID=544938 RepID=UPI001FEE739D|nr:DUF2274 domain-containing protein [Methylocystis sp. B8]